MEDYFKPDKRWEMYGLKSQEEYAEKVVIKGYFHDQIPEDVVQAFRTAEYLMAHAYYHWEMFDEALKKCLLIFEIAIKKKSEILDLPLYEIKKNGKKRPLTLFPLIEQLCSTSWFNLQIDAFHQIRKVRNLLSHPDRNSFTGPNGTDQYIKHLVNAINRLFSSKKEMEFHNQQIELFSKKLHSLNEHVLKVEGQGDPFLLSCIHSFQPVGRDLIMSAFPMRPEYKSSPQGFDTEYPNTYLFEEYLFKDDGFEGITKEGLTITISATDKPQNIKAKEERDTYIKQLDKSQRAAFISTMNYQANWEIVKAEYEYNKERYKSEQE